MIQESLKKEIEIRTKRISHVLKENGFDAILITSNANLYYTSGRVFSGYTYICADGNVTYFVKRPLGFSGDNVVYIRKPEQIADLLAEKPIKIAFELDSLTVNDYNRLSNVFVGSEVVDGSAIMRKLRSVKTSYEIEKLKESGIISENLIL